MPTTAVLVCADPEVWPGGSWVTHFYFSEEKKCYEIKRLKFRHDDCLPLALHHSSCVIWDASGETEPRGIYGNNHETYVKLYVNVEDQASITCPKCQAVKVANVKKYKGSRKPLSVKCHCGWIFYAILETRKYYRKYVKLTGSYTNVGSQNYGPMVIENLSVSGIGFRTRVQHAIRVGDILHVKLTS